MFADTAHYYQLIAAMLVGIVLFVGANVASEKTVLTTLLLLIPFQIIDSRYGSLNVVMTYAVGIVFLLRGRVKKFPLIGPVLFILFSYLLSLSQIERGTLVDHAIFLTSIGSNFLLFYIVYNYFSRAGEEGPKQFWHILIALNVLVLAYCVLQLSAGLTGRVSFGLQEFTLNAVRGEHQRLTGPFLATAMTAEYLCIQNVIIMYAIMHATTTRNRKLLWLLFAFNCGILVTTGNRGGIVTLVIGLLAFVYMFRNEFGGQTIMKFVLPSILLFTVMSVVVIKFTDFNVLFDRLEQTEMEGVVPDTRGGWGDLLPIVLEKPVFGHGPRLKMSGETYERHRTMFNMPFPHNAAMFLMYTIGGVGLLAYLIFFLSLLGKFLRTRHNTMSGSFTGGIPRVAIVILIIIAVSQLRMEMFRFILNDYQQYVMMLIGGLLATLTTLASRTVSSSNSRMIRSKQNNRALVDPGPREV